MLAREKKIFLITKRPPKFIILQKTLIDYKKKKILAFVFDEILWHTVASTKFNDL